MPIYLTDDKEEASLIPSIKTARDILGRKNVFLPQDVARVWGEKIKDLKNIKIPLLTETLKWCSAQNAKGTANWHLIYNLGQTMTAMFSKKGESEKNQPCFHPEFNYNPKDSHGLNHMHSDYTEASPWIANKEKANFQLIDLSPRFKKMSYNEQEKCIEGLGRKFFRTKAPVFAEAIMSVFMISKKRIAETWHHWAPEKHMWGGYHVAIGRFIPYGLVITSGYEGVGYGTIVSRAHDF